uniref:HTH_Tnp_Tc3_2 domain-containing protein n=1 Tax=Heterorhabditis bacteriophora TaxID=37862 RepID=A0A1I7W839_HETBA
METGKRTITKMASNTTASVDEIRSVYFLTVSKIIVQRILKVNPFIRWERMKKYPTLTADHKKVRMDFARAHMSWTSEWTGYKLHFIQKAKHFHHKNFVKFQTLRKCPQSAFVPRFNYPSLRATSYNTSPNCLQDYLYCFRSL